MFKVTGRTNLNSYLVYDTEDETTEDISEAILFMFLGVGIEIEGIFEEDGEYCIDDTIPLVDQSDLYSDEDEYDIGDDDYEEDTDLDNEDDNFILDEEDEYEYDADGFIEEEEELDIFYDEVETEVNVFNYEEFFNQIQIEAIRKYYRYYSKLFYNEFSTSEVLTKKPWKQDVLQKLQGGRDWSFGGMAECGANCECTLGHPIRWAHYAISPKVENPGVYDIITFGETCADDFFDLSENDSKIMKKVRKTMSMEMKEMAIACRNREPKNEEVDLFLKLIYKMEGKKSISMLNDDLGDMWGSLYEHIYSFIRNGILIPKTMIYLVRDRIKKYGYINYLKDTLPEYETTITSLINRSPYLNASGDYSFKKLVEFILYNRIAGRYAYDPISKVGNRADGDFNKQSRAERARLYYGFARQWGIKQPSGTATTLLTEYTYMELIYILACLNMYVDMLIQLEALQKDKKSNFIKDIGEMFKYKNFYVPGSLNKELSKVYEVIMELPEIGTTMFYKLGVNNLTEYYEFLHSETFINSFNELLELIELQQKEEEQLHQKSKKSTYTITDEPTLIMLDDVTSVTEDEKDAIETDSTIYSDFESVDNYFKTNKILPKDNSDYIALKLATISLEKQNNSKFAEEIKLFNLGQKILDSAVAQDFISAKQWYYIKPIIAKYEEMQGVVIEVLDYNCESNSVIRDMYLELSRLSINPSSEEEKAFSIWFDKNHSFSRKVLSTIAAQNKSTEKQYTYLRPVLDEAIKLNLIKGTLI